MKNRVFIASILLSFAVKAPADTTVLCSHSLRAASPLFQNALDNIYSFNYVRHALMQAQHEQNSEQTLFCTSSLALSKNIYQYFEHLIQVDVYPKGSSKPTYSFHFLFQNASVQAFHNVGGQPWVGLKTAHVNQALKNLVDQAQFARLDLIAGKKTPFEVASQSRSFQHDGESIDKSSLSAMRILQSDDKIVYLVTWLTKSPENPFAGEVLTRGVLVSFSKDQQVQIAENIYPKGDLLIPLERQREELLLEAGPSSQWVEKLLEIGLL